MLPIEARSGRHPITPDGRYFVVKGRLWRMANPALSDTERQRLVTLLMNARRAIGSARRASDPTTETASRLTVDQAKRALGERGPVWWDDGAPDLNRRMAKNTDYAEWFARQSEVERASG